VIILLCFSEFHMNVLKAEQFARMQRRKDEERMLVSDIYIYIYIYICLDQKIFVALSAT
jgi:hypothetical protein